MAIIVAEFNAVGKMEFFLNMVKSVRIIVMRRNFLLGNAKFCCTEPNVSIVFFT